MYSVEQEHREKNKKKLSSDKNVNCKKQSLAKRTGATMALSKYYLMSFSFVFIFSVSQSTMLRIV